MKFKMLRLMFLVFTVRIRTAFSGVDSFYFLSDPMYESKVLNQSGQHIKDVSQLGCSFHCLVTNSCVSFAANTSPEVNDCILYGSNLCDPGADPTLISRAGYRVYDKFEATVSQQNRESCYANRNCIVNAQFNNYTKGHLCPGVYTFNAGVCYRLVINTTTYYQALNLSTTPLTTRMAKVRDQGAMQLLMSLMSNSSVGNLFLGLRNRGGGNSSSADWRWEDGTALAVPNSIWYSNDPNYTPEEWVVLQPPDYCWNDVIFSIQAYGLCQNPADSVGKCPTGSQLYNNTCYLFTPNTGWVSRGGGLCSNVNVKGVIIQTSGQWQFIVSMIKNSSLAGAFFSNGVRYLNGQVANSDNSQTNNFGQWCSGQPDAAREGCALLQKGKGLQLVDVHCTMSMSHAREWIASSCSEWYSLGHRTNGMFQVLPRGATIDFQVYCNMIESNSGQTVILSRQGATNISFLQNFTAYRSGFGNLNTDFFIGLDSLFLLTSQEVVSLSINVTDTGGRTYAVGYSNFRLSKANNSTFSFQVDGFQAYSGELKDEMSKQQNVPFSVDSKKGGWWFAADSAVNLNGVYPSSQTGADKTTFMQWSSGMPVTKIIMKVDSTYFSKCLGDS